MTGTTHYIGNELEVFSQARNWKKYWADSIRPYLGPHVLEVGCGIGGTTRYLSQDPATTKWVCLEPDAALLKQAQKTVVESGIGKVEFQNSYLAGYKTAEKFDSVLYADVIEHIEQDADELKLAATYLKTGGHLIIIVPAHLFLYSAFDKAIGHYRRYNKKSLKLAVPPNIDIVCSRYMDAAGLAASLTNKLFLKQNYPTLKQVLFWDRFLVPFSKVLDRLSGFHIGKSIVMVGRKTHE